MQPRPLSLQLGSAVGGGFLGSLRGFMNEEALNGSLRRLRKRTLVLDRCAVGGSGPPRTSKGLVEVVVITLFTAQWSQGIVDAQRQAIDQREDRQNSQ